MIIKKSKKVLRKKRHNRIRRKLSGTAIRPRLSVFKSNKYISVQIIDDEKGNTLVSATTQTMDLENKKGMEAAKKLGEEIAIKAKEKKIKSVVFDRSGYLYHGKVKALADAAKSKGLII